MSITQPSPLAGAPTAGATAKDLRSQPAVGVIGICVAGTLCLLLGVAIAPLESLQILGSVTTFALPILIASALWWQGWLWRARSAPPRAGRHLPEAARATRTRRVRPS